MPIEIKGKVSNSPKQMFSEMYSSRLQVVYHNVTIIFSYLRVQFWGQSLWILWVEWEISTPRCDLPRSVFHTFSYIQRYGKRLSESRSEWAKTQWKVGTLLSRVRCMQEGSARYICARWDSSRVKCTGKNLPKLSFLNGKTDESGVQGYRRKRPRTSKILVPVKVQQTW